MDELDLNQRSHPSPPAGTLRPIRVVVVDDDPDVLFLLGRALHASGHFKVVGQAADGDQGVRVAAEHRPDLVLLDLYLPGSDGLATLPRIREVCPPSTVVVVMSALASTDVADKVVEGGAAAFLPKGTSYARFVDDVLDLARDAVPARPRAGREAQWRFPAELTSGGQARKEIRQLLASWQLQGLLDETELLATELINNAVVHAGSHVLVSVKQRPDVLRVEVTDVGAGTLHRARADLEATHGRGLLLVEAISAAWGTAVSGEAKTVWFELSVDAT